MKNAHLLILASLIFFLSRLRVLFNEYVISNDSSQHHFWMYKFTGAFFKEKDIIAQFAEIIQPKAYVLIYQFLLKFLELKFAILTVEYLIFIITCIALLEICKRYFPKNTILSFILIIATLSIPDVVGGFSRSFSFFIIIIPIYFLTFKFDHLLIGAFLFLSGFLYPVSFLISAGVILSFYGFKYVLSKENKYLKKSAVCIFFCLGAIFFLKQKSEKFNEVKFVGPVITKQDILKDPLMGKEGRVHLKPQFEKSPLRLIGGQFSKATSAFIQIPDLFKRINIYLVFILGLTPFSLWIRRIFLEKRLDEISILIISLLFTGIILFFAARLLPFKLYMPLRYLEKTFPIAVTLVVLYLFNHLRSIKFFYAISYSFFGILLIGAIYNNNYRGFNDYSEYKFVFSELEKTDKKSLIIAPPLTADMIPFFSKRSVLVSKESCHGVYYQYYREDQMQKMSDLIKLYTAPDLNDIIKIAARHQVDYIVLDKNFIPFSDLNEEMEIFSPFNNKLENLYAQKMIDKSFFINLPEAKLPIFAKNDRFLIVECEKFKTIQNIFSGDQKSTVEVNY